MNKIRKTILLIILAIGFVVTAIILYNHQGSSDTQNYIAKIVPLEIKYIVDLLKIKGINSHIWIINVLNLQLELL